MEVTRKEIKEVLLLDAGFPILHNPDPYFQSVHRVKGRLRTDGPFVSWIHPQSGYLDPVELPPQVSFGNNMSNLCSHLWTWIRKNYKKFYKINLFELELNARRVSYKNMWILKSNNYFKMIIFPWKVQFG